jgi:hypothetical protein
MAGETQKSTALTNRDGGTLRESRLASGRMRVALDTHQFAAATELEAADVLIFDIPLPSNAIVLDISHINDDMDTDGSPALAVDIGVSAREGYTSITSSSATKHSADDLIDADLFCDGVTGFQAATTSFTSLALDTGTFGADDALKPIWEKLGYDEDPHTTFNLNFVSATAATALASAADCAIKVEYLVD